MTSLSFEVYLVHLSSWRLNLEIAFLALGRLANLEVRSPIVRIVL